jgi:hypothetical protein
MKIEIENIKKVNLRKDDILILTCANLIPFPLKRKISRDFAKATGHEVMILDGGFSVNVITKDALK